jgi:hypothetical protein
MAIFLRTLRIVRNLLFDFAVLVLLLLGAVQIEQRILRARAERLHDEIISLTILKTSEADAERILSHWDGKLERKGNCETGDCYLGRSGDNWVSRIEFLAKHRWLADQLPRIGFRFVRFGGSARIINGVVSQTNFFLELQNVSPPDKTGYRRYQVKGAIIQSVSNFREHRYSQCGMPEVEHPEYCVTNPVDCPQCAYKEIYFTPFAEPSDVARITQINFYCITRWSPCEKFADLIPGAAADYISDAKKFNEKFGNLSVYAQEDLKADWIKEPWIHAREMENVVIAEVASIGLIPMPSGYDSPKPYPGAKLRLIEKLKGAKDWGPDELKDLYIGKNHPVGPPETYAAMHVGARFIVLFASDRDTRGPLDAVYYGVWPLTDANLAQVKFGVTRDFLDAYTVMQ